MKRTKKIRNYVFRILHPGQSCYCLYCEKSYGRFLHAGVKSDVFKKYKVAGGGYKKNISCPNCGSVARQRLLALFFKLRTDVFHKTTNILHVSPNASLVHYLNQHNTVKQVIGAYEPEQFPEFSCMVMDIQKINLENNLFDVVICCHVLEHVDQVEQAMREIYRILKPNGFAVLQTPIALNLQKTLEDKTVTSQSDRKKAYGQVDHVRLFGLDYFDKLRTAGFRVVRDNPFSNQWLPERELARHCLERIEDVVICFKDAGS
jgi:SAM-dependent methyltransferase